MTTEAYIYEAIRTPRGRGKKNGSLHSVKPIDLTVGLIEELRVPFCGLRHMSRKENKTFSRLSYFRELTGRADCRFIRGLAVFRYDCES